MYNPIEEKRRLVQERISKSFDSGINVNEEADIEKAAHGFYSDNAKNRKLNRVGQEYGTKKQEEMNVSKPHKKERIDNHASVASTDALKRAVADKNAKPEVREAAKKELEKRNNGTEQKNDKAPSNSDEGNKKFSNADNYNNGDKNPLLNPLSGMENEKNPEVKRLKELIEKKYSGGGLTDEEERESKSIRQKINDAKDDWRKNYRKIRAQHHREETKKLGAGKLDFSKLDKRSHIGTFDLERGDSDNGLNHVLRVMNAENKRELLKDIDVLNEKLGTDIKLEDFKQRNNEWYGKRYELFFNTETGEFDSNIHDNWKKKKEFKDYSQGDVEQLFDNYILSTGGEPNDFNALKKELSESIKNHGSFKVVHSLVDAAVGVETSDGKINNRDEAKCFISEMLSNSKIKTDKETKKYLEYNKDNVWWA